MCSAEGTSWVDFFPVRSAVGIQSDLEVILPQIGYETWFL